MPIRNLLKGVIFTILITIPLATISSNSFAQTNDKIDTSYYHKGKIQNKYGLDPATALPSRIKPTTADVIKMFEEAGMSPRQHQLTATERLQVENAFAQLPPLHQIVLKQHLRSISFLDNMPNTALTSIVNTDDTYRLYDITFRAEIFRQNVSQWLTEKERGCFAAKGSALSVSVVAGEMNAFVYVLMHEATHVVDGSLGLLEKDLTRQKIVDTDKSTFTTAVWDDRTALAPQYRNTILDSTRYRNRGKIVPIDSAMSVYRALARTPFVSLYSTSSRHEDLAEYLTIYHFTQKFKQPFKIIMRDKDKTVFVLEPMKSKIARSRMNYMRIFYRNVVPV